MKNDIILEKVLEEHRDVWYPVYQRYYINKNKSLDMIYLSAGEEGEKHIIEFQNNENFVTWILEEDKDEMKPDTSKINTDVKEIGLEILTKIRYEMPERIKKLFKNIEVNQNV